MPLYQYSGTTKQFGAGHTNLVVALAVEPGAGTPIRVLAQAQAAANGAFTLEWGSDATPATEDWAGRVLIVVCDDNDTQKLLAKANDWLVGSIPGTDLLPPADFTAHWSGEISGGQLVEETSTYPATITGGVTRGIGRVGEAANITADGQYGSVSSAGLTGASGSVSFFANYDGVTPNRVFCFTNSANARHYYGVYIGADGKLRVFAYNNGTYIEFVSVVAAPADTISHFVVSSDGATVSVHINGVAVALTVNAGANSGQWFDYATFDTFGIGAVLQPAPGAFAYGRGLVNRLRIYPRVLTEQEIIACACERAVAPSTGALLAYNFRDLAAGVVPDSAPGADGSKNATVTGTLTKVGYESGIAVEVGGTTGRCVQVPAFTMPSVIGFSFELKTTSTGAGQVVFETTSDYNNTAGAMIISVKSTGELHFSVRKTSPGTHGAKSTVATLDDGVARRVYCQYDSTDATEGQLKVWIDGVAQTLTTDASNWDARALASAVGNIGARNNGASLPLAGGVSDFRVYSGAVTDAIVATLATVRPKVPTLGLVSEWFGEGDGADELGNNDATLSGVTFATAKVGQGMVFSGAEYAATGLQPVGGEYMVSTYYQPDSFVGRQALFGDAAADGLSSGARLTLGISGTNWEVSVGDGSSFYFDDTVAHGLSAGTTYHAIYVVRNGYAAVYVNGVLQNEWTTGVDPSTASAGVFTFGRVGSYNGLFLIGVLDQPRLYYTEQGPLERLALANEDIL